MAAGQPDLGGGDFYWSGTTAGRLFLLHSTLTWDKENTFHILFISSIDFWDLFGPELSE